MSFLQPRTESAACNPHRDLRSLVMIGTSLRNCLGFGLGPRLNYTDPRQLSRAKKSHEEVHALLENLRGEHIVREALVLNTCHRYEVYGWLMRQFDDVERENVVSRLRNLLFSDGFDGIGMNVLRGQEALHHLLRTTAGLNSGLPGDRDVTSQLQTALRLANHAGTAGTRAGALVDHALTVECELRNKTAWGSFRPGYCLAAFSQLCKTAIPSPRNLRYTVIGGSTTSRSILHMLSDSYHVPKCRMTLVYRGHKSGKRKLLRAAIGDGQRLLVKSYHEAAVMEAIAQADVVLFGIDRSQPVLDAGMLRDVRDFRRQPLIVMDFNTLGSTSGLDDIQGVTLWTADRLEREVRAYAEDLCSQEDFITAAQEADDWIERQLPRTPAVYRQQIEERNRSWPTDNPCPAHHAGREDCAETPPYAAWCAKPV